jgi:hypothetical protein
MKNSNTVNVEQANKDAFFSPVRKVETQTLIPGFETSAHNTHAIVVTRPDGVDQLVNFVSQNYGLLDNNEFFPALEKSMRENKLSFDASYGHQEHCKYYATYTIKGRELSIGKSEYQDKILPQIKIMRSYSSQIGFRLVLGFYRQICSNGMWGFKSVSQANLKHTQGNLPLMYESINTTIAKFIEEAKELTEVFQVLGDRKVTHWNDRVLEIASNTAFSAKHAEDVIERITIEHNENGLPITDWLIYNGFNYQLNHSENIQSSPEAKVKLDKQLFKHILDNPFDQKFEVEEAAPITV